jgi:integral membrane protein
MSELRLLRSVVFVEGVSYLVLVFVAMPLKYFAGIPIAVRLVGGLHGFLFVSFLLALFQAKLEQKWQVREALRLLGASLIPGSLFWLDRRIRTLAQEAR